MKTHEKTSMSFQKATKVVLVFLFLAFTSHIVAVNEKAHSKSSSRDSHWEAPAKAAARQNPVPGTAESMERGRKLFAKHCAVCHGPEGRGNGVAAAGLDPKPENLVKMAGHHTDGEIAWKIANGRGPMPAWKETLSQKDIWHLTNFIQGLGQKSHSH